MKYSEIQSDKLKKGSQLILEGLNIDLKNENFIRTPERMAETIKHMYFGIEQKNKALDGLKVNFPSKYKDIIFMKNLKGKTLCPHHLLPIQYIANFAYYPRKNVVGASKPYKLFETLAAQPIMQEDLTEEFIKYFWEIVKPFGCIIEITGSFFCFEKENIDSHQATVKTLYAKGIFESDPGKTDLFLNLIR